MYHLGVIQRGRRRVVAAIAITGVILATIFVGRHSLLRAAGWMLVADDPIRPADAIVIAVDAGGAGVLEAADLVHAGISRRVALLTDPADGVEREFERRGIPNESGAVRQTRQLKALGVDDVDLIPREVVGTEDEGTVLPIWCQARNVHSIVVVSGADHTRRLRRVLRRAMKGSATAVMVRRSRYSEFDPDCWWRKRSDLRVGIIELEKLFLDVVRHPLR